LLKSPRIEGLSVRVVVMVTMVVMRRGREG
jgi:hypothetical protein